MFPIKRAFVAGIPLFLAFATVHSAQTITGPGPSSIKKIAFESPAGYMGGGTAGSTSGAESSARLLEPAKSDIYVRDPVEATSRWIAEGQFPAWSPDGSRLAYCVSEGTQYGQIRVVNANGKGDRQLTHIKGGAYFPQWSPDGKQLAITLTNGVWSRIVIIDENGNVVRDLGEGREAHWSADGSRLVFIRSLPKLKRGASIWIIGTDGSGQEKILDEDSEAVQTEWLPDGKGILFASARNGLSAVFTVDLRGKTVRPLRSDPKLECSHPVLSPDGKDLVIETATQPDADIQRFSIVEINGVAHTARMLASGIHASILWSQVLPALSQKADKSVSLTR